jgi:hypothetical protein
MNIADWLRDLALQQYEQTFRDNAVDLETLPHLTELDLEKLDVLLGHRKRMLTAIAALRALEPKPPPSRPPVQAQSPLKPAMPSSSSPFVKPAPTVEGAPSKREPAEILTQAEAADESARPVETSISNGRAAKKRWMKFFIWGGGAVGGLLPMIMNSYADPNHIASALVAGKDGAQGAVLGAVIGSVIGAIVDATRKVSENRVQPVSALPNSPSVLRAPVLFRTFEEAKTELENRNYKVIVPYFTANKIRVERPDGSQELVPNRLFLPAWTRKELGANEQPVQNSLAGNDAAR